MRIESVGRYLPSRKVLSTQLDEELGFKPGLIEKKLGVAQRYWAAPHETTLFMARKAIEEALANANVSLHEVDCIISASALVPQVIPSTASLILAELGHPHQEMSAFDIDCTCLSFLQAVDLIRFPVAAGRYRRVLLVSSEMASVGLQPARGEVYPLFGDGAVAVLFTASDASMPSRIVATKFHSFPEGAKFSQYRGGGTVEHPTRTGSVDPSAFYFEMNGPQIYKIAAEHMLPFANSLLSESRMKMEDISYLVPHQASGPSLLKLAKKLGVPEEKLINILHSYGNQVAASIPMGLYEAIHHRNLQRGQTVFMLGAAAGLILGGVLLVY